MEAATAAGSPCAAPLSDAEALRVFDERVRWQAAQFDALQGVEVVVGIPFYTERDNVVSQLVTLRQVFQERRQAALIVVVGEFSRCDCVEAIAVDDIEEPEPCGLSSATSEPPFARLLTFWKPHKRYQGKPWSVRAAQLVAAAADAHLMIVDADIQFNHFELSAHSLTRTLLDPLLGVVPQRAAELSAEGAPADEAAPEAPSPRMSIAVQLGKPASMVSLNAPRSYLSDDGIVHLFSALLMHACLGTRVHQPMGGEFSLHASFNAALLSAGGAGVSGGASLPPVCYNDAYCVQSQLLTRALVAGRGPVVERLMRGKWHAKIGLAKILDAPAAHGGKSRIDLVTERMFDDAVAMSAAGVRGAADDVELIAAGRTFALKRDGAAGATWVRRSRQMAEGGHLSAAAGEGAAAPRPYYPGVYPDPLAQQMCVLAPPVARKEMWAALKTFLRDFLAKDLAHLPEACGFANDVLPVLHRACAAPRGAFRVLPDAAAAAAAAEPPAALFGGPEWASATAALLRAYRGAPPDSDERRACVHANRLSWLLGALAFCNATVAGDWGAAHERLDSYCAAFRAAYVADFLDAPH